MKNSKLKVKNKIHNFLMSHGKKSICENKFIQIIKFFQKINKKNHIEIFKLGIVNSAHIVRILIVKKKKKKKKQKNFREFPYVINQKNRILLGIKFIFKNLNKNFYEEFLNIVKNKSNLLKTKEISHISALTKKKYLFFRWFF